MKSTRDQRHTLRISYGNVPIPYFNLETAIISLTEQLHRINAQYQSSVSDAAIVVEKLSKESYEISTI
jgi:hypothetical protein